MAPPPTLEVVEKPKIPWVINDAGAVTVMNREALRRPKKARERHKMVAMLAAAGWTNPAIAEAMGYTAARVSQILNSRHPELLDIKRNAAQRVMDHTTDAMLRFKAEANNCIDTLVEIRDDREAPRAERRQSAIAILDRGGYSPVRKQMNLDLNVPVSELNKAVEQLEAANEVYVRKDEWQVKTITKESQNV